MARGSVAVTADDYQKLLKLQKKSESMGAAIDESYDEVLDYLINTEQQPKSKYPGLPDRINRLRNQGRTGPEIFKELRPTEWGKALAGLHPFKGTIYKDTYSELGLMLKPFSDAVGLAADFLPGFETPPNFFTEEGRREAGKRYPALAALTKLGLEAGKLIAPMGRPTYTGEEFKKEFPMISGLASYYAGTYNVFTPDGLEAFRRHLDKNPAGFMGDFVTFFAPPLKIGKAAVAGSKVAQAIKGTKLAQSAGGQAVGKIARNLSLDPVGLTVDLGGKAIGKGATLLAGWSGDMAKFIGSKLAKTPVDAATEIIKESNPTIKKMIYGELTQDEIIAPFIKAADEAWEVAKRNWKQNEGRFSTVDEFGNPKNYYYMIDDIERVARTQLEKLNVTLKSREDILKEAVMGEKPQLLPGQMIAGKPRILEEAIVTQNFAPQFKGRLETDSFNRTKIKGMWNNIQSTKNEALLNGAKRADGKPFIGFDDLQDLKQAIDYIGGREGTSSIYKVLYGPVKGQMSTMMNEAIDNYNILNESWQKDLNVLQGAETILNLPEKNVQIRQNLKTPTEPEQMPKNIAEREAAIAGIFNIFTQYTDFGRDGLRVLNKLVPEDLPGMAAGIHFTKPSGMAGGVVYLGAAGKSATRMGPGTVPIASPALHASALALSSPKLYGKLLLKWVGVKETARIMKKLKAEKLGPFRFRSMTLITTPGERAIARLPSRAEKGKAMTQIWQAVSQQPPPMAEPIRPYTQEQIRRQQGWPARPE